MRRTLRAGLSLFRIRAAEGFQYRMAALSGAAVSIFWALIEVVVLTVFFKYGNNTGESINGMTLAQGISYLWIAQSTFGTLALGIDEEIRAKITNGDVSVELCRPLSLYWHWYARTAAGSASTVLLRGGIVFIFGALLSFAGFNNMGLGLPQSPLHLLLFMVSLVGALLFGAAFNMFITSIRMGIAWGDGPINLIGTTGGILSGAYLPLQLWPDFAQTVLRFQPFASSLDIPARLFVGSISLKEGGISILFQILWIAVFIVTGQIIMKHKIKNAVVQGG